jgi:hypothetical protein
LPFQALDALQDGSPPLIQRGELPFRLGEHPMQVTGLHHEVPEP